MLKGSEHILESFIDITKRKKAEEELKRANIELKKIDKLKMQFLNLASHELRTPITPIIAQLQMIRDGYFGDITEEQEKSIDMILRNTAILDRLIEDILDISRLESGTMKFAMVKANLNEILKNAVEIMKSKAMDKNISLRLKEDNIPEIVLDKDRITQVVVNLIDNAIKFTGEGGCIDIELIDDGNQAMIKVRDTGIGLKKEDQKKIFLPFEQVDSTITRHYGGSGLGLAICRGIVACHGGKIWVESEPEKGSTFIVTIPYNYREEGMDDASVFGIGEKYGKIVWGLKDG
jgi:signal transduction histidine kinase